MSDELKAVIYRDRKVDLVDDLLQAALSDLHDSLRESRGILQREKERYSELAQVIEKSKNLIANREAEIKEIVAAIDNHRRTQ